MTSFELCKKLKETDFPYLISQQYYTEEGDVVLLSNITDQFRTLADIEEAYVPIPTLEDLFHGLGDDIVAVGHPEQETWQAVSRDNPPKVVSSDSVENALAALWVELRK